MKLSKRIILVISLYVADLVLYFLYPAKEAYLSSFTDPLFLIFFSLLGLGLSFLFFKDFSRKNRIIIGLLLIVPLHLLRIILIYGFIALTIMLGGSFFMFL